MWQWMRKYWLLCVLVLLGEGAVGGLFFVWIAGARKPETEDEVLEIQARAVYEGLEILAVNPAGTAGLRVLFVQPVLLVESEMVIEELESEQHRSCIRDALVGLLSRKQIHELDESEEVEDLKQEMIQILNHMLKKGQVVDVCFKKFVLQ